MTYNLESVACNVCGADNFQTISNKGKNGLPTNVVLCKNCGLGYLNPRWDSVSYMSFYRNEYDHYYRPKILKEETYNENDVNPIEKRLKQLGCFPESADFILEIGSGEGKNLKHFSSLFPLATLLAIEPSIESQHQLNDVERDWEADHLNKIDIILMRHVLEHFMNPLFALKKIRKTLTDSGIIYIAVPNNLNPTKNLEGKWFRNVHTYYFNKYSLNHLMNLAGLEVLSIIEGDQFNKHEVFLIVRKSVLDIKPIFSTIHYSEQLEVFLDRLKYDKKISQKIMRMIRRFLQ
jgi:SAM-dependent methyltransferase